ncbi:MAG TPA: glycoside hydrolase family 31 protein [Planctomycetota bacterium]|nr:glycoside hydrolase family 31 protein [Planctomycetota bacterium]
MLRITSGPSAGELSGSTELKLAAGEALAFDLASGGHWFGHGFSHDQPWPLEAGSVSNPAFAVNNIQSPIWMCSAGYAIIARTDAKLEVSINANGDGLLKLRAPAVPVAVEVFRGRNLPEARAALMATLGWPNRPPSAAAAFGDSLFCTWTQYPRCITGERILGMARAIREQGYPCSTLIIDDRWESCFGELEFSKDFPDPAGMVRELHALGFKVWLWVTPFVNQEAAGFADLAARKVLVPARAGGGAALFKWWGGTAGLVDLSGAPGRDWYRGRLERLRSQYGVDGFKIDGGDFKYQPAPESAAPAAPWGPSGYPEMLLGLFEHIVPNACETRTAWLSQRRSVLWREGGKDSHWGRDNGLKAVVSLGLHLGLMGYDLLIPDMVPGRVQTLVSNFPLPTDELMVRWTEASAFMPLVQFSYFPWNYCEATERAVRGYALAHKALGEYLAAEARERTAPLLRPIWFDAPEETGLYTVADEYLLGGALLAAPVLDPGVAARDVVLPPGEWVDAWTGTSRVSGLVRDCSAPCPGIPLFVRRERPEVLAALHAALRHIERGSVPTGVTTTTFRAGLDRDLSVTG